MSGNTESFEIEELTLKDVQPLFGGQNFFLESDGLVFVESVNMREKVKCKRYKLKLSNEQLKELADLISKHNFFTITIPERPGKPDEARPTIRIKLRSGEEKVIKKWANDTHQDFDAIYNWLLDIIKNIKENLVPFHIGVYEHDWTPDSDDLGLIKRMDYSKI